MSVTTTTLDLMLFDTKNLSTFAVVDTSQYVSNLTITNPTIEITAPGFPKVALTFTPNSINIFNPSNLSVDCTATTPLPDGVYTIKYSIYPNDTFWVQKQFMRTEQLYCKYKRVFLGIDLKCSCNGDTYQRLKDQLRNIRLLIESSIADSNDCNIIGAYDKYNKASNLLDKVSKCQCNC